MWRGYATGVKVTTDAGAEWIFSSLYDRLDDVQVAGDDDENRAAIPAQNIMDEVSRQLPDVWPTVDASAWAAVFRPPKNTSARDFVAKMLTAEGRILVPDANGELEVRTIGPRQDTFDPAVGLTLKSSDLLSLTVKDDKEFLYNTITFTPHGADTTTYQGELELYREPGNFIHRYGRREIQMTFDHLSPADAVAVAEEWQGRLLRPRRRCTVKLQNPESQILLLDRVKLEFDDQADIPIPLWGEFIVSAVKINLAADTVEIELEDTREDTQAPPTPLLDAAAPTVTIAAVAGVNEGDTLDLSVSVSGGTFDTLTYAWDIRFGGGTLDNADTSAPTYNAPAVASDTSARVRCIVTANGNGGNAATGTSDTNSDTEDFTVLNVVGLPDAAAPAVTIAAVTEVDEGDTLALSASVAGGTYDALAYAWVIVSGGGSISNANTSAPTYNAPSVSADATARVRCTVTATGTGTNAATGTSDTDTDTEDFTVRDDATPPGDVLALSDWPVPSGETAIIRALIEAGSPDLYNSPDQTFGDTTGTLLDGDLTLAAGQDITRIRNQGGDLRINDQPSAEDLGAPFDAGGTYENGTWYLVTLDSEESIANSGSTFTADNTIITWSGAISTLLSGLSSGDRFILGLTEAIGMVPDAVAPAVTINAVADGNEGAGATLGATISGGTYDELDYAWTVSGGTLNAVNFAAPTWTRPLVTADTDFDIDLEITARGTGTNAASNTSDDASAATVSATVLDVVGLTVPSFADNTGDAQAWTHNAAISAITVPAASGNPAPAYAVVGALPSGISFNTGSRVLSGTPTAVGSGTIRIRATNSQGSDDWTAAYTTTAAVTGAGYQLINLDADWWGQLSGSQRGWEPGADAPAILSGLAEGGTTDRTLFAFGVYEGGLVRVSINNGDLSDEVEENGGFRLTVGGQSWVFLLAGSDPAEPYFWFPDNTDDAVEIYGLIDSATAATLEISDDPDTDFA